MRTICSIFRMLFAWFDFGKEVASLTKIIRNDGPVFSFCSNGVDTGFFSIFRILKLLIGYCYLVISLNS